MDGRSECNPSLAYAAVHLDCPAGAQIVGCIDVKGIVCVCVQPNLCVTLVAGCCSCGGAGYHLSTLVLPHHQLPSISPTGALYDACQLITSDSI